MQILSTEMDCMGLANVHFICSLMYNLTKRLKNIKFVLSLTEMLIILELE